MAFIDLELSIFGGKPNELYKFVHGTDIFCYSSILKEIVYDEDTYTKLAIHRERIGQTVEINKTDLSISCPISSDIAQLYLTGSPENIVTLTIFKQHQGADDTIVLWKGRVISAKVNYPSIDFSCEAIYSMQKRSGLRARYLRNCRHVLYGDECRLNKEDFVIAGTVAGIDDSLTILTVPEAAGYADGYFIAGMISTANGAFRFIVNHVGSTLTLSSVIMSLAAEDLINLYPGCDHSLTTCRDKFNNLYNNGAFPWIPTKNPFEGSIL